MSHEIIIHLLYILIPVKKSVNAWYQFSPLLWGATTFINFTMNFFFQNCFVSGDKLRFHVMETIYFQIQRLIVAMVMSENIFTRFVNNFFNVVIISWKPGNIVRHIHYNGVIMCAMTSQITSLTIVYSTVYSGADQRKHQAPRHWPLCREFTGDWWISTKSANNPENVSIWWSHHVQH